MVDDKSSLNCERLWFNYSQAQRFLIKQGYNWLCNVEYWFEILKFKIVLIM